MFWSWFLGGNFNVLNLSEISSWLVKFQFSWVFCTHAVISDFFKYSVFIHEVQWLDTSYLDQSDVNLWFEMLFVWLLKVCYTLHFHETCWIRKDLGFQGSHYNSGGNWDCIPQLVIWLISMLCPGQLGPVLYRIQQECGIINIYLNIPGEYSGLIQWREIEPKFSPSFSLGCDEQAWSLTFTDRTEYVSFRDQLWFTTQHRQCVLRASSCNCSSSESAAVLASFK